MEQENKTFVVAIKAIGDCPALWIEVKDTVAFSESYTANEIVNLLQVLHKETE